MLKIATPISHLFEDIENAKEIIAISDCLELRERSAHSTWPKQNLFHIDVDLNHIWTSKVRAYLRSIIDGKGDLELISFQATTCCDKPVLVNGMYELGGQILSNKAMLEESKKNVDWLREHFGSHIEIAVENNNYYPTLAYDIVTEGQFLTEIVKQNEISFLFDIAHAQVTAHNKSSSYEKYLDSLPLERSIQLHICKPNLQGSVGVDAHDKPDRYLLNHVSQLVNQFPSINYLTVEYYRDKNKLVESLGQLKKVLGLP